MDQEKINIILIDYQPIFREGIKRVLESESSFHVLVNSDDYSVVTTILPYQRIDVLLIDIHNLIEHKEKIQQDLLTHGNTKVVVLATENERRRVIEAVEIGAHGFILKEMDIYSFIDAIHIVCNGKAYIHPTAASELLDEYRALTSGVNDVIKVERPIHLYTRRECEVLQKLAEGKSNRAIAEELRISEKTVKNHVSNLFRKMKVNDRTQAVVTAIRNNWVEL